MWEAKAVLSKTAALDRDKAAEITHDRFYNERCLCIPTQVFFYDDSTQNKEYVVLAEEIENEQYPSPLKPCTAVMGGGGDHYTRPNTLPSRNDPSHLSEFP